MSKVFTKIDKCTVEDLRKFNDMENAFFRFHDPERRLSSRSKSWEMGYHSEAEARREYKNMDLDPDDAILNGKSCTDTAGELLNWSFSFGNGDVVIVFKGVDTRTIGHDGETVATYIKKLKTYDLKDFFDTLKELEISDLLQIKKDYPYYDKKDIERMYLFRIIDIEEYL